MDGLWSYVISGAMALFTGGTAWQQAKSGIEENTREIVRVDERVEKLEERLDDKLDKLSAKTDDIYKILIGVVQKGG